MAGAIRAPQAPNGGPVSPAELARQEAEFKIATIQAANAARAAGDMSGDLARAVETLKRPALDWRDMLRRFITSKNPSDYRWSPPNRRYVSQGLYLPALRPDGIGELALFVDTSGSITDHELARFARELNSILDDARPDKVHVVYCDAAVKHVAEFTPEDMPVTLEAHGGGGTDFRPPFAWLADMDCEPACIVYLTDLEAPASRFPSDPGIPTMWITTGRDSAPFGDVVRLGD